MLTGKHNEHYSPEQFNDWKTKGYINITDPNTGINLRMNSVYFDDMNANSERYNLKKSVESLTSKDCPVVFIRGNNDKYIEEDEAMQLVKWSNNKYELEIVTGSVDEPADHNFGMPAKAANLNSPMNWMEIYLTPGTITGFTGRITGIT